MLLCASTIFLTLFSMSLLIKLNRIVSEFGISNASAQCIGYQEAVDMVTLGEVYKSSQLVIVSLRVCSGPQQTRSFYRVSDRAEISTDCNHMLLQAACLARLGNAMRQDLKSLFIVLAIYINDQL